MNMAGGQDPVLVGAALGLVGLLALAGGTRRPARPCPYTDPDAVGSIGLCNQAGQQITSGSVTAKPFAWRAVSTQPAPAPYNNAGRTATLVAYQPQQGLPAGDWSGAQMTSSSRYTNPANPMAAATAADQSLQDIIDGVPTEVGRVPAAPDVLGHGERAGLHAALPGSQHPGDGRHLAGRRGEPGELRLGHGRIDRERPVAFRPPRRPRRPPAPSARRQRLHHGRVRLWQGRASRHETRPDSDVAGRRAFRRLGAGVAVGATAADDPDDRTSRCRAG